MTACDPPVKLSTSLTQHGAPMNEHDHNAFLAMHEHTECENPFDQEMAWNWDDWDDWEDETNPEYWGV